ncbi:MAG: nuclear transport factor 2 family protein, partial [Solirubrobacterales bacterium]
MSQENVEIVRRGIEALNRRDIDAWLEGFQPDVEAHDLPTIPDAPVRRGHDDLRRWVEMMGDTWEEKSYYEPEEFTAADNFVLVAVRAHAWGRGSGAPVEVSFFWCSRCATEKSSDPGPTLTRRRPSKRPGCG